MIRVTAKFKENIYDKKTKTEIPYELALVMEAQSVESQPKGIHVDQKFNGRTEGIFLRYKDLTFLQIDDATIEDFGDKDFIESVIDSAMATLKLTFAGENYKISQNVKDEEGKTKEPSDEDLAEAEDIDITDYVKYDVAMDIYFKADEGYTISSITIDNADIKIIDTNEKTGITHAEVFGMKGNVLLNIDTAKVEEENA